LAFIFASQWSLLIAKEPAITAVTFADNGSTVVACSQSGIHVYDWPNLRPIKTIKSNLRNIHDVEVGPSGDLIAVAGGTPSEDGAIEVYSWPAGELAHRIGDHEDSVMSFHWKDDLTLVSASLDTRIKVWSPKSREPISVLNGHSRGVTALAMLDATTIVSAGIDQSLRVWDLNSATLAHSLSIHTGSIHDLALRPGDHTLAMVASASQDKSIRLWQPKIGRMVRFARLDSVPLAIEWFHDGSRIVASCDDGHIRVIDPETVEVVDDIAVMDGWAYAIAVHPTDQSVVVAGSRGRISRIVFNDRGEKD
jgi:WD40 repeat protein